MQTAEVQPEASFGSFSLQNDCRMNRVFEFKRFSRVIQERRREECLFVFYHRHKDLFGFFVLLPLFLSTIEEFDFGSVNGIPRKTWNRKQSCLVTFVLIEKHREKMKKRN